jgi:hypothetical protein
VASRRLAVFSRKTEKIVETKAQEKSHQMNSMKQKRRSQLINFTRNPSDQINGSKPKRRSQLINF